MKFKIGDRVRRVRVPAEGLPVGSEWVVVEVVAEGDDQAGLRLDGHPTLRDSEFFIRVVDAADPVNSPDHYQAGGVETIDIIKAWLTEEEFRGYLKGASIKYLARHHRKGAAEQDLRKCGWYVSRLVGELDA